MLPIVRAFLFGILVWSIEFMTMFYFYPLREAGSPLLATIRTISLVLVGVFFTFLYFRTIEEKFLLRGIELGLIWLFMSLILDQFPFVWGGMRMSFGDYLKDTGLNYLVFPIITIGAGAFLTPDTGGEAAEVKKS